ncbi:MAG: nicotinate (nicotinamide) nucleotide adenylyltransferase [Cytophagales bacterium]|nr:nicotinate (nicotinamide) nucleotide adenylyltransferase [Bernardetiaceae bacterium]MDW8211776.1 nicotinate (nicotinamide) nucleotide adenylyltransferase [Cytophagales bacterium]
MKIGLFFGSFNPIHIGHLIIANTIAESSDFSQVWFVVSPHNPFKQTSSLLHEQDRMEMVRIAIADNYKLNATDVEFRLPRPNYTIDTLTHLSEKYPQHEFRVIIGQDNLSNFIRWKNYRKILEYYGLIVYPRYGATYSPLMEHPHVSVVDAPLIDISATFIRECIKKGRSIRYLVPDEVMHYIMGKKLYL